MNDLTIIKNDLQKEFGAVETHIVASPNLQHNIFVVNDVEISVSLTMVYFRVKAPSRANLLAVQQQIITPVTVHDDYVKL